MTEPNTLPPALTAEELAPLFWRPSRLGVESAWYGHVPFAHWVVAAHRPRSIVELGTHNGVSYAAFCEAVLRCRLDARCMAIDTWQGDEHAGFYGSEVLDDLQRFHDQRYGGFSTLHRARFQDALGVVPDGSVDLLHIDGRHRHADVLADFTSWRAKLSPRGVVLFHDTNVRHGDFGVWKLWAQLREQGATFEFLHAHGLGVLAYGEKVSGPLAALCGGLDPAEINTIRERFALLGERWVAAADLEEQRRLAATLNADLQATKTWAETAQADVNKVFPMYQALVAHHRAARANLAQARHDLAAREHDVAALRLAQEDYAGIANKVAALAAQAADLRAENAALLQQRDLLFASTSWRLTAPLRAALDLTRGRSLRLTVAPPALAGPAPSAPALPAPAASSGWPRALFISGEDHTPGTIYRVDRYVAAAIACGFDARAMTAAPVGPPDLENIHLVVLWRVPYSNHVQGIIDMAREQGARVIFDVDDLMFRPEMAVIDIIDGIRSQKFSELETQAFFTLIGRTLKACDLVTCPTAELAHHARRMGRPAYVLPNGFDDTSHATARRAKREWAAVSDDLLRIGYAAGSRTHQRDFAVAVPAILRVLRENDRARLVLFRDPNGGEGVVLLHEFPEFGPLSDRIEWRDMVKLPDLPKELARFTINIAPLEPGNPFCEAKSELKYFEAALAGVPTIASPAGPFKRAILQGTTGFIAETDDDWYQALTTLLHDAELRARIATAAYHDSLAQFGPASRAQSFSLMLAQIAGGAEGAAAFERERHRASLPRLQPPHIPAADVMFTQDRMQDADITVIVPVYNYADYVPETLASVAAQTLSPLDLVIIDDASPDDSNQMVLDWLKANAARFNRVTLLRHRTNAGLGFARNSGFAAADTPYILPLDADNRLRPEACATLLSALRQSTAAFAYPAIQQFGDATEVFGTEPYSVLRLQRGNYIDAMALVRKSAWAAAGGYDHVQYGWEDYDLWCRLAERGYHGVSVPDILADYRVHKNSMLHTMTELRDHKGDLIEDIKRRHPWVDVSKQAD